MAADLAAAHRIAASRPGTMHGNRQRHRRILPAQPVLQPAPGILALAQATGDILLAALTAPDGRAQLRARAVKALQYRANPARGAEPASAGPPARRGKALRANAQGSAR